METKTINLKRFLEALVIVGLLEGLRHVLRLKEAADPFLLLGGTRILEILSLILLFCFPSKDLASLGLAPSCLDRGVKRGLIWSLGFGGLAVILFFGLYVIHINPLEWMQMRLPEKTSDLFIFFLIGGLIGPVAEEIFFRGILYGFFRRWGIISAILLSTVIFVLLHLPFNSFPISQAIGGILFALAYEVERNLYTPIVIHSLGNLAIFFLSFLR